MLVLLCFFQGPFSVSSSVGFVLGNPNKKTYGGFGPCSLRVFVLVGGFPHGYPLPCGGLLGGLVGCSAILMKRSRGRRELGNARE